MKPPVVITRFAALQLGIDVSRGGWVPLPDRAAYVWIGE